MKNHDDKKQFDEVTVSLNGFDLVVREAQHDRMRAEADEALSNAKANNPRSMAAARECVKVFVDDMRFSAGVWEPFASFTSRVKFSDGWQKILVPAGKYFRILGHGYTYEQAVAMATDRINGGLK